MSQTRQPKLFEPRKIGVMAPATKFVLYAILLIWALFVLFPIYWLLITSVKTPAAVNQGPYFLPFLDFQPSLHAWKELFVTDYADTLRAYMNSIIIALCSTGLSVLVGSMAAYALSRVEYAPNLVTILYLSLIHI